MEEINVKKFGPSCGEHGSSVFYKAFKYKKDGRSKIISLGQFFFMKILDSIPICIGEVQLVWEDKASSSDLASVRLYFMPECTPEGRQSKHGEDEVLAYYEKIVLKLSDLAAMVVHDVSWSEGRRGFTADTPDAEYTELAEAFQMNSYGLDNRDVMKEKDVAEAKQRITDSSPDVVILTYPRYCRYRCMLKRLENIEDKWLRHTLVAALGGFAAQVENNRVYFCKNIFEHADLDDFELRCDHLAPNLKGRPRKRRGSKQDGNESSEESSCNSSVSTQPETAASKVRTGSRATPLRNGFRIDKIKVSKDEQAFLIELHKFMKSRNTPIGRIPSLGFKQIDLFQFYCLAEEIGGYEQISMKRMWKHLYDKLGGNPGFTSAATCTRRHYEKLLLPFERYKMGQEFRPVQHKRKKIRSEGDLPSMKVKVILPAEVTEVKVIPEAKIKPETSIIHDTKLTENGKSDTISKEKLALNKEKLMINKEKFDMKDRALIIKQEIEKMKMRKGRRPSGGQKTVRELLHQNGQDPSDNIDGYYMERATETKQRIMAGIEEDKTVEKTEDNRQSVATSVPQVLPATVPQFDTKPLVPQTILPNFSQPRPMFYPQFIPVGGAIGGAIRNMTPVGMPFMLPQFGFQTVANQMQTMQAIGNTTGVKDEKPLYALSKLVCEQSAGPSINRSAISTRPVKHNPTNVVSPPSAHSSQVTSKGPIMSPGTGPHAHRPIIPAHSQYPDRPYPYPDTNSGHPTYTSNVNSRAIKAEAVSDSDLQRQKLHTPQEKQHQSGTGEYEVPVLDLSMKTLRAQEARHQRGESLLFNTSFNKENKTIYKSETCDAPQDLSLKSKTISGGSERPISAHKSVPLNIPLPRVPATMPPMKMEDDDMPRVPAAITHMKLENDRYDMHLPVGSKAVLPISSGSLTTIGGLPIDIGSFVHPAFPQQMLMQGVFPTPLQLQQMIQGQVAAGLPMLRPDFVPSPLMFPPNMPMVTPTMFSNVLPSVANTNAISAPIVKR